MRVADTLSALHTTLRCRDLVLTLLLLPLAVPVLVICAMAIALESRHSPLFTQLRVGLHGKVFRIYKLRTMHADQFHYSRSEEISLNDPRVTRIGRSLRRWKLDELPQLFNVLRGDMSFVGPRPDLPQQATDYDKLARQRLRCPPGLTGIVQVSGNCTLDWRERFRLDAWYVKQRSLALDARIMAATMGAVLRGEEASADPLGIRQQLGLHQ